MNSTKSEINEFRVVIPVRLASQRLPNKPLLKLTDKTLIEHVYQNVMNSGAAEVMVATDAPQIADCVRAFGGNVYITATSHTTGTDRIAETVKALTWADDMVVVNVQGDEPFIAAEDIRGVAADLVASSAQIATRALPLAVKDANDPNIVKVVRDQEKFALYFSRAAIPYRKNDAGTEVPQDLATYYQHLGIYAYHCNYLARFAKLSKTALERAESLEQLRALAHGDKIYVGDGVTTIGLGINNESDLQVAKKLLE